MSTSTALGRGMATVGILGALTAATVGVARADEMVKIGEAAPVTGPASYLGKDTENGARLAVEEANQSGLVIGGRKVTLVFDAQDDAGDPRQATQVAQKLVDDKVVAVVGHMQSGSTIPASKIYSDAGIVQVSPSRPTRRTRCRDSKPRIAWSPPTRSKGRRSPTMRRKP